LIVSASLFAVRSARVRDRGSLRAIEKELGGDRQKRRPQRVRQTSAPPASQIADAIAPSSAISATASARPALDGRRGRKRSRRRRQEARRRHDAARPHRLSGQESSAVDAGGRHRVGVLIGLPAGAGSQLSAASLYHKSSPPHCRCRSAGSGWRHAMRTKPTRSVLGCRSRVRQPAMGAEQFMVLSNSWVLSKNSSVLSNSWS